MGKVMAGLAPLAAGQLKVTVQLDETGKRLDALLAGNADMRSALELQDWLHALHLEAARLHVDEVVIDLRTLEFMNSSCFKGFLSWISEVRDGDAAHQYRIRFLSDPSMLWQRRSLHALSCFAVDLITIEAHS
jgi:hypothetical protein